MKVKLFLLVIVFAIFQGCSVNNSALNGAEYIDENSPVCGQYSDGSKQTFPTMKDLNSDKDAHFLYEGPCYGN